MPRNGQNNTSDNIDTSNIFEEFENDTSLKKEVKKIKEANNKDMFYYFSKIAFILQNIFWLLLLIGWILYAYVYVQNNEEYSSLKIGDWFCKVFIWNTTNDKKDCSSITFLHDTYEWKLKDIKSEQIEYILSLLEDIYKVENFNKTKEVIFLLTKSDNRLKPLEILEKFDDLKTAYQPLEKSRIQCYNIVIDENNTISVKCDAFAAWFEKGIKGFNGDDSSKLQWTALSVANSFINFIEQKSDNFSVVSKDKIFKLDQVIWDYSWFTNKTTFSITLKYHFNQLSY